MVVRMPQGAPARDRAETASSLLSSSTRMLVAAGDDDPDRLRIYAELAGELIDRASLADRMETARLLAGFAPAPRAILRRLARDEWVVAEPILTRAPNLTAIDLLGLLAVVSERHAEAIARRPGLADDVMLALINRGEVAPTRALLANPAFSMTRERADALAAMDHADPVILAALGRAPRHEDKSGDGLLASLDTAARARVIATLEARRALQPRAGRPVARAAPLAGSELFSLATRSDFEAIAERLAKALGLDLERATASVMDPGGEPLLLLLRAAGLSAPEATRVLLFHPAIGRDVAKTRWLGELNDRLGEDGARLLVEDWRGRPAAKGDTTALRVTDPAEGVARPAIRPEPRAEPRPQARPSASVDGPGTGRPADRAIAIIRARLG